MHRIRKIVVVGPESTGKSTLCSLLAEHFETLWVREYAREYLLKHGTAYRYEDLLTIARGQLKLEEEGVRQLMEHDAFLAAGSAHQPPLPLFVDTDMYVMKVWCEFVFNQCHPWILDRLAESRADLYLLAATDAPWVKDELREYPDPATRDRLYRYYKDHLVHQSVPWVEISGNYVQRLQQAIAAVQAVLQA